MTSASGNTCQYINCGKSARSHPGLKLYRFPTTNYQKWITNLGNSRLLTLAPEALRNRYVCEGHFTTEAFTKPDKKRLFKSSVPLPYKSKNESSESSPEVLKVMTPKEVYKRTFPTLSPPLNQNESLKKLEINITPTVSPQTQNWLPDVASLPLSTRGVSDGNDDALKILKNVNEKIAINSFANGLENKELRTIIKARNYSQLSEAIKEAKNETLVETNPRVFHINNRYHFSNNVRGSSD
ncbi:hypothetical protein FQR65_LT15802 [Abscondita terminalis]|nr:hypothetical protein FQR65_LT15802 [Abscondita terminalis]